MEFDPIPINMLRFNEDYKAALDGNFLRAAAVIRELNRQNDLLKKRLEAAMINPTGGGNPEVVAARLALDGTEHATLYDHIATIEQSIEESQNLIDQLFENIAGVNSVMSLETGTTSYYVNGTTGSDDTEGSQDAPFKTIAKALSKIPIISVGATYNIYVADGVYDEPIELKSRSGCSLYIIGNNTTPANVKMRKVILIDNFSYLNVSGFYATVTDDHQFFADRCSYVNLTNCHATVNNLANGFNGIEYAASKGVVLGCVTSNGVNGINARSNSQISVNSSNTGSGNTYGVASNVSLIHKTGSHTITGTTANERFVNGGIISNGGIVG